jgi:hypothetical protein
MNIWHRVAFDIWQKEDFVSLLDTLDIQYRRVDPDFIAFDIHENDPRWEAVNSMISQKGASDFVYTTFDETEIIKSQWLSIAAYYKQGYPQPDKTWLENKPQYQNLCSTCGTYTQTISYRIRQEPHLEKYHFFSFHWTTEIFCTHEVVAELSTQPFTGYEFWDVILDKKNMPSETIRQIYIPNVAKPGLRRENNLEHKICDRCGTKKYLPHKRGKINLDKEAVIPGLDIFLTHEWFGDGRFAFREIIVSNRFAGFILGKKWKGVQFKVVEAV